MDVATLDQLFPSKTIVAKLIDRKGNEFTMINGSAYSTNKNKIEIILLSESPMPTNRQFIKILLKSTKTLNNIQVKWKNCGL